MGVDRLLERVIEVVTGMTEKKETRDKRDMRAMTETRKVIVRVE